MALKQGIKYKHYVPKVKEIPEWYKMFNFILVESIDELREISEKLKENPKYYFAFDTETSSLDPESSYEIGIVGYSFCTDGKNAYYVAVNHYYEKYNLGEESLDILYEMLCGAKKVIAYNARFDIRFVEYQGYNPNMDERFKYAKYDMSVVQKKVFDVSNSCWLADTNEKMPTLKNSALHFLGYKMQTFAEVSDGAENFYYINPENCYFYASSDALCTYLLVGATVKYANEAGYASVYDNGVLYPLMHCENERIYLDKKLLEGLTFDCQNKLDKLERDIYEEAGGVFKLNSPAQVSNAFQNMGIDTGERTKTGYMKTGIELLQALPQEVKENHPLLAKFIEFKTLYKFLSSYVKVLHKIAEEKGYARCSYKTLQVPTGRLASGKDKKNTFFSAFNIQSSPKPHPMMYYTRDLGDRTLFSKKENIVLGFQFIPAKYDDNGNMIDGSTLYDDYLYLVEGFDPKDNVRSAFLPRLHDSDKNEDYIFCSIDFSGQELRIAANFSQEPVWTEAFLSGGDIHKSCYSLDTEILTPTGFKTYDQIGVNDLIAQYNDDTECIEWVKAGHIYWNETSTLYHFKASKTDILVTPNHRMWTRGWDNWYIHRADKIYKRKQFDTICSPQLVNEPTDIKYIEIPSSTKRDSYKIPIQDFMELLGYVLSDGGTCRRTQGDKSVYFGQSKVKPKILEKMQNLNTRLKFLFKESIEYCKGRRNIIDGKESVCNGNFHTFSLCSASLYDYIVSNFGGPLKKDRYLPKWFKELPLDLLEIFVQALFDGDGGLDTRPNRNSGCLYIPSKQLCDDVQIIYMGLGYATHIGSTLSSYGTTLYRLHLIKNRRINRVSNETSEIIELDSPTKTFCFAVPSGLLVVRRNGKISVCGNTAINIWGEDNYDKEKRKMAKAANFAVIYGASAYSFIGIGKTKDKPEGMTEDEAHEFFENYKKGLPTLFSYQNNLVRRCKQSGTVKTFFGRPRRVKFYFKNGQAGFGRRTILNTPIQGTAGDILKIVMCKVWKDVLDHPEYKEDVAFKCTVHDEINYGIKKERLLEIARRLEEKMSFNVAEWEIPLTVEVSFGWSWGSIFDFAWNNEDKMYYPKKA